MIVICLKELGAQFKAIILIDILFGRKLGDGAQDCRNRVLTKTGTGRVSSQEAAGMLRQVLPYWRVIT